MKKLLIAAACMTCVAGLHAAAPTLNGMLDSVKLSTASVSFMSDVQLAKDEAFQRNTNVVMCKSADGETCAAQGGWDQGWILFADANANGRRDRGDKLILRSPRMASNLRFQGELDAVVASAAGAVKLVGVHAKSASLVVCGESAQWTEARRVVVDRHGESRSARTGVPACT